MSLYTEHIVNEMDESMVQRCVLCGEVIEDYNGCSWPANQDPPTGWPAGSVFVMKNGGVTHLKRELDADDRSVKCD